MMIRTLLTRALLLLATALPLTTWAADPANPAVLRVHKAKADFPEVVLTDRKAQGERAVELLGDRLPEVAAWYGKSADEFRSMLRKDRHLRIDNRGRLFVEDDFEQVAGTAAEQSVLDGNLLPLDQTFLLHSRPGAKRTIYLNFKGATLQGTAWNSGGTSIIALPYDLDGIPYSFNTLELQRIQGIWQRVAEDFAPFDVDVTTEQPPPDALTRSSASDQIFGTTVLITKSTGVFNCSCGGVAYIGVFDNTGDFHKPALVFYNNLSAGAEKPVAEAISHEAGHNVGLGHDGTATGAYYGGHGTGLTSWAPIMGVGYSRNVVQWSKGEYTGANNAQDDFVVAEANGLPIRLDDHGDTLGAATLLTPSNAGGISNYGTQGVIERQADIDMFSFTAAAGAVTVTLTPAFRSPNLDTLVELRDAAGTLLASANPGEALNASLTFNVLLGGTYYVSVQGVGKGEPLSTGYSDYGSLGNYALSVTALTLVNLPPVANLAATPSSGTVPLTVAFSAAGSTDPDGSITAYDWTFGDGSTASGASVSHVYTTVGAFSAQLKVTDNLGLSSTRNVVITANPVVAGLPIRVAVINMSLSSAGGFANGVAVVKVVDSKGVGVSGVTIAGAWSGLVAGNSALVSNSLGNATFVSPSTKLNGVFTFTVTGVTRAGYTYNSALNTETADSITR